MRIINGIPISEYRKQYRQKNKDRINAKSRETYEKQNFIPTKEVKLTRACLGYCGRRILSSKNQRICTECKERWNNMMDFSHLEYSSPVRRSSGKRY